MKRMIFHLPNKLLDRQSASHIRPRQMIRAFQEIGYCVDVVEGEADKRKENIQKVLDNIKQGVVYDFLYSESSTMPTLLTAKNHVPLHPLLDFSFFKKMKKHHIPIGLFYRDIHWRFETYQQSVSPHVAKISRWFYNYDIRQYNRWVDVLYLPSLAMIPHIPNLKVEDIKALPSGCHIKKPVDKDPAPSLFYVGGIDGVYDITELLGGLKGLDIRCTICCREDEWQKRREDYQPLTESSPVEIVHASHKELDPYFEKANIGLLVLKKIPYFDFTMPYKLFEYIGNGLPVIGIKDTAFGRYIETHDLGWTIENDRTALSQLLKSLKSDPSQIRVKTRHLQKIQHEHSWQMRASTVANDLIAYGSK